MADVNAYSQMIQMYNTPGALNEREREDVRKYIESQIDFETGAPGTDRAYVATVTDPAARMETIRQRHRGAYEMPNYPGNPIIPNPNYDRRNPQGQKPFLLWDPTSFEWGKDVGEMAMSIPEAAGGVIGGAVGFGLGSAAGAPAGPLGATAGAFTGAAVGGAAGAQVAGQTFKRALDLAAMFGDKGAADRGPFATQLKNAGVNFLLDAAGGLVLDFGGLGLKAGGGKILKTMLRSDMKHVDPNQKIAQEWSNSADFHNFDSRKEIDPDTEPVQKVRRIAGREVRETEKHVTWRPPSAEEMERGLVVPQGTRREFEYLVRGDIPQSEWKRIGEKIKSEVPTYVDENGDVRPYPYSIKFETGKTYLEEFEDTMKLVTAEMETGGGAIDVSPQSIGAITGNPNINELESRLFQFSGGRDIIHDKAVRFRDDMQSELGRFAQRMVRSGRIPKDAYAAMFEGDPPKWAPEQFSDRFMNLMVDQPESLRPQEMRDYAGWQPHPETERMGHAFRPNITEDIMISNAYQIAQRNGGEFTQDFLDLVTPKYAKPTASADKETIARNVFEGTAERMEQRRGIASRMYDKAVDAMPNDVEVDPVNVRRWIEQMEAEASGAPGVLEGGPNARPLKLARDIIEAADADLSMNELGSPAGSLNFKTLWNLRKLADGMTRYNEFGMNMAASPEGRAFLSLRQAIDADRDAALELAPEGMAKELFDKADAYYANVAKAAKFADELQSGGKLSQVYNFIVADRNKSGQRLTQVMGALPRDHRNVLRASLLMEMGMAKPHANSPAEWSPRTFITNWNNMSDGFKNRLLGGRNSRYRRDLDKFVTLAQRSYAQSDHTRNFSNTAQMVGIQMWLSPLLEGFSQAVGRKSAMPLIGGAVTSGAALFAPQAAARLITNKDFMKWVANVENAYNPFLTTKRGRVTRQTLRGTIGRLAAIAENNPEIQTDIGKYLNYIYTQFGLNKSQQPTAEDIGAMLSGLPPEESEALIQAPAREQRRQVEQTIRTPMLGGGF